MNSRYKIIHCSLLAASIVLLASCTQTTSPDVASTPESASPNDGEVQWIDPNDIQPGPVQRESLTDEQMERARALQNVLVEVDGQSVEQCQEPTLQVSVPSNIGICTVETWKNAWPGCGYEDGVTERHLSVVDTPNGNAFRVDYALGQIGPEKGGVGWRYPLARSNTVELNYTVEFSPGFDWVKGGKLPGLCGGPKSVTGGRPANGKNGFSARLMWRADGRGEAYVYHMNQPKKYGQSFPFPATFRFPTTEPVNLRLRVSMNTPGRRDGKLDVWVRTRKLKMYQHVVSDTEMEWRSGEDFGIDSLLFETFHGGGDNTWAPRKSSFALFNGISVRSAESN